MSLFSRHISARLSVYVVHCSKTFDMICLPHCFTFDIRVSFLFSQNMLLDFQHLKSWNFDLCPECFINPKLLNKVKHCSFSLFIFSTTLSVVILLIILQSFSDVAPFFCLPTVWTSQTQINFLVKQNLMLLAGSHSSHIYSEVTLIFTSFDKYWPHLVFDR